MCEPSGAVERMAANRLSSLASPGFTSSSPCAILLSILIPPPVTERSMFAARAIETSDKPEFYRELAGQLEALLAGESDAIANAANTSALIYHSLPDLNWAGFYFLRDNEELVLGPFQGKPACVRIAVGRSVCGTAAARRVPMLVDDVLAFPGHIACDSA